MWYPEALPLCTTTSKTIAQELVQMFTWVGLPKKILMDQGTPFMSRLMRVEWMVEWMVEQGQSLTSKLMPQQLQQMKELVKQHMDVFSVQPGCTTVIQHHIGMAPGVKVYSTSGYPLLIIRAEVEKMLDSGIIEESSSAWLSPIVLVPKPDGSWMFCNGLR
ncbi:hypothetical protein AAFF_G00419910 [Aldrovandia affinis]|uniref:Integrase catalytic domain-containing protein n=1 Tax=Aldrovandia affinis TaxID=143900 RepID=A0AAD7SA48_9TELE|nr:hypothetical protein AAFF_G00419910 [Aldrovandia affinis]